jgi:hypothetical protein
MRETQLWVRRRSEVDLARRDVLCGQWLAVQGASVSHSFNAVWPFVHAPDARRHLSPMIPGQTRRLVDPRLMTTNTYSSCGGRRSDSDVYGAWFIDLLP